MALVVADTDILIDALEGREPAQGLLALELESRTLATTAVSVFELLSGASSKRVRTQAGNLLQALTILPLDQPASVAAAEVRRELEGQGMPIGMADYLIAGICLSVSAVLLTRNRAHFERVRGLHLSPLAPEND